MKLESAFPANPATFNSVAVALWFGLLAGWGSCLSLLVSERFGWRDCVQPLVIDMIWIVPALMVAMFGVAGITMATISRPLPRIRDERIAVALFAFLTIYEWLRLLSDAVIDRYARVVLAVGLTVAFLRASRRYRATHFWRGNLLLIPLSLVLSLLIGQFGPMLSAQLAVSRRVPAEAGSPNLVVVVIDTLRADHLSSYGYSRRTSPNIDRIAGEGVLFESSFSSSSWTVPSHASMLTGLYPHEHGAEDLFRVKRRLTLGDALHRLGYRTAAFSANKVFFTRTCGFGAGFDYFEDYSNSLHDILFRTPVTRRIYEKLFDSPHPEAFLSRKRAPELNHAFLRWVDQEQGRPFFAFLNYFDVHDPYITLPQYRNKFSLSRDLQGPSAEAQPDPDSEDPLEPSGGVDAYDGGIAYVDEHLGDLFVELTNRGLNKNTIVVITSDHGEAFGERGYFIHGNGLYIDEIHVPLIFWGPPFLRAGARIRQSVTTAALPATLMHLAKLDAASPFRGPPLSNLWQQPQIEFEGPAVLSELAENPEIPNVHVPRRHGWVKSLVTDQWHCIMYEGLSPELYSWRDDRRETKNMASTADGKLVTKQCSETIAAFR